MGVKILVSCFAVMLGMGAVANATTLPDWTPRLTAAVERADCDSFPNAHWLSLPLDKAHPEAGQFDFFFAFNHPLDLALPTALFVDGGPGAIFSPSRAPNADRIDDSAWNLVSFHIRGAGCSQIPLARSYDRYLSSAGALSDIESLRRALGISRWDLVIGESYGSWLAQKYASGYPGAVRKLLLEGIFNPSWVGSENSNFTELSEKISARAIHEIIKKRRHLFPALRDRDLGQARRRVALIVRDLQAIGPSVNYQPEALAIFPGLAETEVKRLRGLTQYEWSQYGTEFFQALAMSRYVGRLPLEGSLASEQNAIAVAVLGSILPAVVTPGQVTVAKSFLDKGLAFASGAGRLYPIISYRVSSILTEEALKAPAFGAYRASAIFINGSLDGMTPTEGARQFAANACRSGCAFVEVQGGGHSAANLNKSCISDFLPVFLRGEQGTLARVIRASKSCRAFSRLDVKVWPKKTQQMSPN